MAAETIEELIEEGAKEPYSPDKLCYKTVVTENNKSIVIPTESFIDKYYDIIRNEYAEKMTMTDEDYDKYKYNPKRLSYDSFGTVELWHLILRINNMSSVLEFNKRTIYMVDDLFLEVLDEMITLEEDEKTKNDEEVQNNI